MAQSPTRWRSRGGVAVLSGFGGCVVPVGGIGGGG
jgi:hypothetical protein